jgi:hypothetical protein
LTADGQLTEWLDATEPDEHGTVVLTATNRWDNNGEELVVTQPLTFRSLETLRQDLAAAELLVEQVCGDWNGEPFDSGSNLIIVEARRP